MIYRIWHGYTTLANAPVYEALLKREIFHGIESRKLEGFRGIELIRRTLGDEEEFITIMRFDAIDDIKAFTGEDYETAYVPAEARKVLKRFDARAQHYELRESRSYGMTLLAIAHVQLAMPKGEEAKARAFYGGVLGLAELEKPPRLATRGGAWFGSGAVQVHLGVEDDFRPALKAHPALTTTCGSALRARLAAAGYPVIDDDAIPGTRRFYTADGFGNRIEIIETDI